MSEETAERQTWINRPSFMRDVLVQAVGTLVAATVAWTWAIVFGYVQRPEGQRLIQAALALSPPVISLVGFYLYEHRHDKKNPRLMAWINVAFAVSSLIVLSILVFGVLDWL